LEGRTAAGCSHEVEAGYETGTRPDPDERSRDQCDLEAFVEQEDAVPGDSGGDCDERDPLRADAVGAPAGWELRGEGRDDEGSRQEPDGRQRRVVMLGERVGDGADVRDIPGQAAADGEPGDNAARRVGQRPPPAKTQSIVCDAR
jgi:hypothetical protein